MYINVPEFCQQVEIEKENDKGCPLNVMGRRCQVVKN